jgi:hypothetical protein
MAESAWGPWGPIYNSLLMGDLQVKQAQQNIEDGKQLAALRNVEVQLAGQRMQEQKITQEVFARELAGGAAAQGKSTMASPDDTPVVSMQKEATRLQQQAQFWEKASREIAAKGGDATFAQKLLVDANNAMFRSKQMMQEARLEQRDAAKQIGSIAGTAVDDPSFQVAMQQLRTVDPKVDSKYLFDRDQGGNPIWGDTTKRTMYTLNQSGMDAGKALDEKIKIDDNLRKASETVAKIAEDNARAAELDSRAALNRSKTPGTKEYEAASAGGDRAAARAQATRLSKLADAAPTKTMIDSAREDVNAYVKAEYSGAKFDDTLGAFANDVAARANKIRADAAARGDSISMDDARYQAIESLKPFIVDKEKPKEGFMGFYASPGVKTYRRASQPVVVPTEDKKNAELVGNLNKVGLQVTVTNGKVTGANGQPVQVKSKEQRDALPAGTIYIGPDGKQWTKQ